MKRRILTDEEKRLWQHVTRDDQPLQAQGRAEPSAAAPVRVARPSYPEMGRDLLAGAVAEGGGAALACGAYAGVDRKTAERFRRGDYPIDAQIDLHGMSRERARMALGGFLKSQHERGSRCVLAITGKGPRKDMQAGAAQDIVRGVLREMVPHWLAEPGMRPLVLAFDAARPKHGGGGAFYILLRRKRVLDART